MDQIVTTYGLTKKYKDFCAVSQLDMTVREGRIYGFLGPNGAGKSTTLKMLLGLVQPSSGSIELMGKPMNGRNRIELLRSTGSLIESPSFYGHLTARENLRIYTTLLDLPEKNIDEALKIVRLDRQDGKKLSAYSLGMKQRLGIALSLMHDPEFLILDEPINGLDPAGIVEMRKLMLRLNKENGLTIIISSHILSELANMATCYGFIDHGQILQEMSAEELEAKEKSYVKVRTSDGEKAAECLSKKLQLDASYNEDDDTIYIYFENNTVYPTEKISRFLFEKGYALYSLEIVKTTLEDFFIELLGGTTTE